MRSFLDLGAYSTYLAELEGAHRIMVAVNRRLHPEQPLFGAMLDSGCEWCVASPGLFDVDYPFSPLDYGQLHTRFGLIDGFIERAPVFFTADEGSDFRVDATWFISPDWNGPVVLGWKGCLERMNFAFDTVQERFWFGPQYE